MNQFKFIKKTKLMWLLLLKNKGTGQPREWLPFLMFDGADGGWWFVGLRGGTGVL